MSVLDSANLSIRANFVKIFIHYQKLSECTVAQAIVCIGKLKTKSKDNRVLLKTIVSVIEQRIALY